MVIHNCDDGCHNRFVPSTRRRNYHGGGDRQEDLTVNMTELANLLHQHRIDAVVVPGEQHDEDDTAMMGMLLGTNGNDTAPSMTLLQSIILDATQDEHDLPTPASVPCCVYPRDGALSTNEAEFNNERLQECRREQRHQLWQSTSDHRRTMILLEAIRTIRRRVHAQNGWVGAGAGAGFGAREVNEVTPGRNVCSSRPCVRKTVRMRKRTRGR